MRGARKTEYLEMFETWWKERKEELYWKGRKKFLSSSSQLEQRQYSHHLPPKELKKSTDDPKYAQSNSRDSITVSYRAMRVRCCLQEERQRKKVSVKQPCLLKKT